MILYPESPGFYMPFYSPSETRWPNYLRLFSKDIILRALPQDRQIPPEEVLTVIAVNENLAVLRSDIAKKRLAVHKYVYMVIYCESSDICYDHEFFIRFEEIDLPAPNQLQLVNLPSFSETQDLHLLPNTSNIAYIRSSSGLFYVNKTYNECSKVILDGEKLKRIDFETDFSQLMPGCFKDLTLNQLKYISNNIAPAPQEIAFMWFRYWNEQKDLFISQLNVRVDWRKRSLMTKIVRNALPYFLAKYPGSTCSAQAWHVATWKLFFKDFPRIPTKTTIPLSKKPIDYYDFQGQYRGFCKKTGKHEAGETLCSRQLTELLNDLNTRALE